MIYADPEKLKTFLDNLVKDPSLKMRPDGTTFCNVGLERSCVMFECHDLEKTEGGAIVPMTAREIRAYLKSKPSEWLQCLGPQAADYAQRGGFGVASMDIMVVGPDKRVTSVPAAHDHVATLYPGPLRTSDSLRRGVPLVANVGKDNGVMASTKAFPVSHGEAEYHIRVG